jgi:hypothetical protein
MAIAEGRFWGFFVDAAYGTKSFSNVAKMSD